MKVCRKWLSVLLAALIILSSSALAAVPADYNVKMPQMLETGHLYGEAAVVVDADTGEVLFSKNGRIRMYPASTTKVMTLLLALESGISMDTLIAIPRQASQIPSDSSLVPVLPGDEMTFRDLLYGMMINSGNDAANAVAVIVSGDLETFVQRMNERAVELGCEGTHFVNPHGYHDAEHYSTAQDLALIASEVMKYDLATQITSALSYTMNITRNGEPMQLTLNTHNVLLQEDATYYYEYCIGIKTGYHSKAGQCFVSAAERDGVRLVAVTLKCEKSDYKWIDAHRLLKYGFTRYTEYTLEQMFGFTGDKIARVKISNASEDDPSDGLLTMNIAQISDGDYSRMVQTGSDSAMENAVADFISRAKVIITHDLTAPISEGEILGNFSYIAQSGEQITALLVASRAVEEAPERFNLFDTFPFLLYFKNPLFSAFIIVLGLLILMLILSMIIRRSRRERRRREIYEEKRSEYMRRQRMMERRQREKARRLNAERSGGKSSRRRYKGGYDSYDEYDAYDEYDDF